MDKFISTKIKNFNYKNYIVYISFGVVLLFFSITLFNKGFLSPGNLMNILRQTAMISVMAVGMTFTISAAEIDLSIGSIVALSALVAALVLRSEGIILAILAGLSVGAVTGLLNGIIVSKVRIPSFLVTLGTSSIISGLARKITNLEAVPIIDKRFNFIFGSGDIGPISTLFLWTLIIMIIGDLVYRKTPFGRAVLATGGNKSAARFSGIRIDTVKVAVMTISAICAAFAGILYAGRLHGARYTLGEADVMTVIAAVVIGGTSFTGGRGTVVGSIIGSIIMGMLNNGLLLMGLSVSDQMIARGIIIILAVSLSLREAKND
ncbi:MAG: ribose transport system permease protein [Thermoanaerobacteraceae bacterium]|jgi:ribose transport system permease protein|nr:ribose transport system permease protein [Thermoanaerobacteraceae bacterium]